MAEGAAQAMNEHVLHTAQQAEAQAQHLIQQHMQQAQDAAAAAAGAAGAANGQEPAVHLFTALARYLIILNDSSSSMQLTLPEHSHPSRNVFGPLPTVRTRSFRVLKQSCLLAHDGCTLSLQHVCLDDCLAGSSFRRGRHVSAYACVAGYVCRLLTQANLSTMMFALQATRPSACRSTPRRCVTCWA